MIIYNNIKKFRKSLGLTQTQLADIVGVSKNAIYSYENLSYFPSLIVCVSLCILFSCKFEDLFYFNKEV